MTRIPILFLLALALLAIVVDAEDKKPQTVKGWGTAVDPDGDCKFEEKDGTVAITVPGTNHDLTYVEAAGKLNAPRIVREVEGDFTIQVKVLKFPFPAGDTTGQFTFVSAGLLVWNDGKEFFRVERAAVGVPPFAYAAGILDGKNVLHQARELADSDAFFRAERKGKKLTFSVRAAEETDWTELLSESFELPAKLQVGVHAVNTINSEFKAEFRELELKQ
jgi:regulation of enolase protein 1 (concanavalin A-like superfamily)